MTVIILISTFLDKNEVDFKKNFLIFKRKRFKWIKKQRSLVKRQGIFADDFSGLA